MVEYVKEQVERTEYVNLKDQITKMETSGMNEQQVVNAQSAEVDKID